VFQVGEEVIFMPNFVEGAFIEATIVGISGQDYVVSYKNQNSMLAFAFELLKSTELVKALL
jgi:hypothetical protein